MKLKILFCEGIHDISFISKILMANGYIENNKKINEYPAPLNKYFINKIEKEVIGDRKIGFNPSNLLPHVSLQSDDSIVFFYNMGGDSKHNAIIKLIEEYQFIINATEEKNISNIECFVFYDADTKGVNSRIEEVNTVFGSEFNFSGVSQGKVINNGDITFGAYIFYDINNKNQNGTLEDLLISLFEIENKDIISKARDYLKNNPLLLVEEGKRTKEYLVAKDKYSGSSKYDEKKSIISLAGQFGFSGVNNSVIIAKSDYIKKETILENTECKIIFNMINTIS